MAYKDHTKQLAAQRASYYKHREARLQYAKLNSPKRKKYIAEKLAAYKATLSCEKCGESHPACLDFHHQTPNKELAIAHATHEGIGWNRLIGEIKKCIVLCANCHRKHHYETKTGQWKKRTNGTP